MSQADRIAPLEATVANLDAMAHRAARFRSPALWNDPDQQPLPPLGTPGEMLASGASLETSMARFADNSPLQRFDRSEPGRVRSLALADTQPIPADADRVGYYAGDDLAYWLSGLEDNLRLAQIGRELQRPLTAGQRFLDLGCASGRVLRHFSSLQPGSDALGVDLCRQYVAWARRHLHSPVLQGTALPNLPFADASVDVVFAGSVFTHINDFEEAWLAELHRVLAATGFAVLTIHSEDVWEDMRADPQHPIRFHATEVRQRLEPLGPDPVTDEMFDREMPAARVALEALDWPDTNVFHSRAWIRERWGRLWRVERIIERSHGYQDCVVLVP
ncbi:MAG TPA: class I SAM-dependent methyltransferase [Solirubrobacterales bacterium]|nr:class I SAM-dependent methyltransferase [Solirubrobacterales bacterium]